MNGFLFALLLVTLVGVVIIAKAPPRLGHKVAAPVGSHASLR
jgi:hypothetical protein